MQIRRGIQHCSYSIWKFRKQKRSSFITRAVKFCWPAEHLQRYGFREFGNKVSYGMSEKPDAIASLAQLYKSVLRDSGKCVAVKWIMELTIRLKSSSSNLPTKFKFSRQNISSRIFSRFTGCEFSWKIPSCNSCVKNASWIVKIRVAVSFMLTFRHVDAVNPFRSQ